MSVRFGIIGASVGRLSHSEKGIGAMRFLLEVLQKGPPLFNLDSTDKEAVQDLFSAALTGGRPGHVIDALSEALGEKPDNGHRVNEIHNGWSAAGYRHCTLTVNGQEIEFTAEQTTRTWLFLTEVLGLAWAGEEGALDKKPGEKQPYLLFPEIQKWTQIQTLQRMPALAAASPSDKRKADLAVLLLMAVQAKIREDKELTPPEVITAVTRFLAGRMAEDRNRAHHPHEIAQALATSVVTSYMIAHELAVKKEAREEVAG